MEKREINVLLENANVILNKYDNDYIRPEETFIHMFDRYILHALEEVYEAREAKEDEFLGEVADITNYVLTMLGIISSNLNMKINLNDIPLDDIETNFNLDEMKNLLVFSYDTLISIRRMYPQRKWHKKEKMDDFNDVLKKTLHECLNVLYSLFMMCGYETLYDECLTKQQYIIGL